MSRLAELTIARWIGPIGLIFSGVLIWSLVRWNKSPPDRPMSDRHEQHFAPLIRPTCRQARARARRPQRADGERQGHRRDAHRARRADHQGDRRKGRQGDPAGAFRPPEGTRPEGVAEAGRARGLRMSSSGTVALRGRLRRRGRREGRRRDEGRRHAAAWRTPASTRKRKRTIRPSSSSSRSSATSTSTTPSRPRTARTPRPKGSARKLPAYAGRTMQAELEALGKALERRSAR